MPQPNRALPSPSPIGRALLLVPLLALTALAWPLSGEGSGVPPGATLRLRPAATLASRPAYYRPVLAGGKVFPVARSNYLSLLEFPDSWHDPRLRLVNGKWRLIGLHEGIDITAERGTPILAMERGVVENVGWTFYSGTRVGIRGTDRRYYFYAHLAFVQPGIKRGARVPAGTVLGLVGNTGYGSPGHRDEFPPHLHFGIQQGSRWVNPYPTLVSLYAVTVRTTERWQADLDRLGSAGRRSAWRALAQRAFMSLPAASGE